MLLRVVLLFGCISIVAGTAFVSASTALEQLWLYRRVLGRGPPNWGDVTDIAGNVRYPTCSSGTKQSPINIANVAGNSSLKALEFHYNTTGVNVEVSNIVSTIQVKPDLPERSWVIDPNLGGRKFVLEHIEFHTPSEHTIGGGLYDMEMMIVHEVEKDEDEEEEPEISKMIVSVFFRSTTSPNVNLNFFEFLPSFPNEVENFEYYAEPRTEFRPNQVTVTTTELDLGRLIPSSRYYTYEGSLTSPPCTEGIQYYLMSDINTASAAQIAALRSSLSLDGDLQKAIENGFKTAKYMVYGNNREEQPIGDRSVSVFTGSNVLQVTYDDDDETAFILGVVGTVSSLTAILLLVGVAMVSKKVLAPRSEPSY